MVPDMTRGARKARQAAWDQGQELGRTLKRSVDDAIPPTSSIETQVEFYRGIGQFFTALAHDLTQQPTTRES